jgi:hypothetical protein
MGSRDNAAGIATRLRIGQRRNQGSVPSRDKSCFSSAQRPHRHWSPSSLLYSGYFNGDEAAGVWSLPPSPSAMNDEANPHSPLRLHGVVLNLIKFRDNFTFTWLPTWIPMAYWPNGLTLEVNDDDDLCGYICYLYSEIWKTAYDRPFLGQFIKIENNSWRFKNGMNVFPESQILALINPLEGD